MDLYRRVVEVYGSLGLPAKVLLVLGVFVLTSAAAMVIMVLLPADHFSRATPVNTWWRRHPLLRWGGLFTKNALGAIVLPLGIFMSLPLVPGPGLLLILLALSLLDFPGKRRLERRLLGRPSVLKFVNNLRRRNGRAPLVLPDPHHDDDAPPGP